MAEKTSSENQRRMLALIENHRDKSDQNITSQTHANLVQINREKEFSLNLEKTLEKKILATKREVQFEYHQTGGGIVGNADAITYELVKNAIPYYYDNMINCTRRVEITKDNDKKGLNLSTVFKVYDEDKHQYTLTLYNTKCKFLVNGKGTRTFIDDDLPHIHKVIKEVVLNGKHIDVKNLNEKLEDELKKLKLPQQHQDKEISTNTECTVEVDNERCYKCKRNVLSKALYCDQGQHWVHYRCLKLNSEEISAIENMEGKDNYICKLCIEKDKTTCLSPVYTQSITNNVIVTHRFQSGAQAILEEELINTCNTCNLPIQMQLVRCTVCNQPNHEECAIYEQYEHICPNCKFETIHNQNEDETLLKVTTSQETVELNSINTDNIERQVDSSIAESEKKTKENKSNELKLREQKLRKREEELKIREKLNEEMQNERIWLQSYVTKMEGRVNELERSNRILQQKCESMAHHQNEQYIRQNPTKDPFPSNTPTSHIEKTLEKMHEKVSHFLVQQMDKQLDKMFETMNSYAPESSDRVASTSEPSTADQNGDKYCSAPHHLTSKSSVSTPITPTVTQDKDINYYQGRPLIRSQDIPSHQMRNPKNIAMKPHHLQNRSNLSTSNREGAANIQYQISHPHLHEASQFSDNNRMNHPSVQMNQPFLWVNPVHHKRM